MSTDPYVLIGADLAQIEVRVLCWLFGQQDMLDKFAQGRDIYSDFGNYYLYPRLPQPISKGNPDTVFERSVCKEAVLGCGFGLGGDGFHAHCKRKGINIELDFSMRAVSAYRHSVPRVVQGWGMMNEMIPYLAGEIGSDRRQAGKIVISPNQVLLPSGNRLYYYHFTKAVKTVVMRDGHTFQAPEYQWRKQGREYCKIYGGLFTENVVQAIARDVLANSISVLRREYPEWLHPRLMVHDELIFVVRRSLVAQALEVIRTVMQTPPGWAPDLPVEVETHIGRSYYDLK